MLKTNHHRRSKLQERRAAKDYGGSVTPGSGNGWIRKADVRSEKYLIECKTTTKRSYSVSLETWNKLSTQALMDDRIPVLEIEIDGVSLIVLDKEDFLDGASGSETT